MPTTTTQSSFVHILEMLDKMGSLRWFICLVYFAYYASLYDAKVIEKPNRKVWGTFGTSSSTFINNKGFFEGLSRFLESMPKIEAKGPANDISNDLLNDDVRRIFDEGFEKVDGSETKLIIEDVLAKSEVENIKVDIIPETIQKTISTVRSTTNIKTKDKDEPVTMNVELFETPIEVVRNSFLSSDNGSVNKLKEKSVASDDLKDETSQRDLINFNKFQSLINAIAEGNPAALLERPTFSENGKLVHKQSHSPQKITSQKEIIPENTRASFEIPNRNFEPQTKSVPVNNFRNKADFIKPSFTKTVRPQAKFVPNKSQPPERIISRQKIVHESTSSKSGTYDEKSASTELVQAKVVDEKDGIIRTFAKESRPFTKSVRNPSQTSRKIMSRKGKIPESKRENLRISNKDKTHDKDEPVTMSGELFEPSIEEVRNAFLSSDNDSVNKLNEESDIEKLVPNKSRPPKRIISRQKIVPESINDSSGIPNENLSLVEEPVKANSISKKDGIIKPSAKETRPRTKADNLKNKMSQRDLLNFKKFQSLFNGISDDNPAALLERPRFPENGNLVQEQSPSQKRIAFQKEIVLENARANFRIPNRNIVPQIKSGPIKNFRNRGGFKGSSTTKAVRPQAKLVPNKSQSPKRIISRQRIVPESISDSSGIPNENLALLTEAVQAKIIRKNDGFISPSAKESRPQTKVIREQSQLPKRIISRQEIIPKSTRGNSRIFDKNSIPLTTSLPVENFRNTEGLIKSFSSKRAKTEALNTHSTTHIELAKTKFGKEKERNEELDDDSSDKLKQKSYAVKSAKDQMSPRDLKNFHRFQSFFNSISGANPASPAIPSKVLKTAKFVQNKLKINKNVNSSSRIAHKNSKPFSEPVNAKKFRNRVGLTGPFDQERTLRQDVSKQIATNGGIVDTSIKKGKVTTAHIHNDPQNELKQKIDIVVNANHQMSPRDTKNFRRFQSFFNSFSNTNPVSSTVPTLPSKTAKLVRTQLQDNKNVESLQNVVPRREKVNSRIHDKNSIIFLDSIRFKDNSESILVGKESNREILSKDYEERFRFNGAFEKGYLHPIDGSFKRKRGFIKGKDLPVLGPYYYDLKMKHPR